MADEPYGSALLNEDWCCQLGFEPDVRYCDMKGCWNGGTPNHESSTITLSVIPSVLVSNLHLDIETSGDMGISIFSETYLLRSRDA